jgi:hypothetical protein
MPLRVLVQNSWSLMQSQNEILKQMALTDPRLDLRIGTASVVEWSVFLDASDFIVLPYDPASYSSIISGISAEAVANAIPQAVPANTGLEMMLRECGNPGVVFSEISEAAVAGSVLNALANFDTLADTAYESAGTWAIQNDTAQLGRAILSI